MFSPLSTTQPLGALLPPPADREKDPNQAKLMGQDENRLVIEIKNRIIMTIAKREIKPKKRKMMHSTIPLIRPSGQLPPVYILEHGREYPFGCFRLAVLPPSV